VGLRTVQCLALPREAGVVMMLRCQDLHQADVRIVLRVLCSGSAYGGVFFPLYTLPTTMGRSGSPSRKRTRTSCPTRGSASTPYPGPAHP